MEKTQNIFSSLLTRKENRFNPRGRKEKRKKEEEEEKRVNFYDAHFDYKKKYFSLSSFSLFFQGRIKKRRRKKKRRGRKEGERKKRRIRKAVRSNVPRRNLSGNKRTENELFSFLLSSSLSFFFSSSLSLPPLFDLKSFLSLLPSRTNTPTFGLLTHKSHSLIIDSFFLAFFFLLLSLHFFFLFLSLFLLQGRENLREEKERERRDLKSKLVSRILL